MINGQFLQYAMTGKSVTMGRASLNEKIDIDLSKEGPATKVLEGRRQLWKFGFFSEKFENLGVFYPGNSKLEKIGIFRVKN